MTTENSNAISKLPTTENSSSLPEDTKTWPIGSLLAAAEEGDLTMVKSILQTPGYNLDETNSRGETALLIATHKNNVAMATLLIDSGADINVQDGISDSPYLFAGAQGRTEILAYMLEHAEPDYTLTNRYGGNALIPASEKGHIDNVRLLLEHGVEDVDHINRLGYTALLEVAALTDGTQVYHDIARLLLQYGANADIKDHDGLTARDYAVRRSFKELVAILDENR